MAHYRARDKRRPHRFQANFANKNRKSCIEEPEARLNLHRWMYNVSLTIFLILKKMFSMQIRIAFRKTITIQTNTGDDSNKASNCDDLFLSQSEEKNPPIHAS